MALSTRQPGFGIPIAAVTPPLAASEKATFSDETVRELTGLVEDNTSRVLGLADGPI